MSAAPPPGERKIVVLLAAVSFVNIVDFMMVMPLGPDFARALGIPTSQLGFIGGSYTAAAAVAGLVGALFLDRFDRRSALAVAMLGLVTGTAAGGLARGFGTLLAARVLAGMFGGPASSIGLSILADVIPVERRGKALGSVMGAFAAASVLGVPAGLYLASLGGWRTPFFVVAGMGLLVVGAAIAVMPPMRLHLSRGARALVSRPLGDFLRDRTVQVALATTVALFCGGFAVIPNLSAYLQQNLGFPRNGIPHLYMAGGIVSFVAMRVGGSLVDRHGSVALTVVGTVLMLLVLGIGFLPAYPLVPIIAIFVAFMLSNAIRSVAMNTLSSRVPLPSERARFMSAQSAAQHIACSLGAILSAAILTDQGGKLAGMPRVAALAMVLAAAVPFLVASVSARVARREAEVAEPAARVAG
jgi:predicted MFS family arabinose efflux permease